MSTHNIMSGETVGCPVCREIYPWASEQAVAVDLFGRCIACALLKGPSFDSSELGRIVDEAQKRGAFAERDNAPIPVQGSYSPVHIWRAFNRLDYFIDTKLAFDSDYKLPTREWFLGGFANALQGAMFRLGIKHTGSQESDCDDLARFAFWYGPYLHAKYGKGKTGFAIGFIIYYPDEADMQFKHALPTAIVREGDYLVPVHYEPQTHKEVVLSQRERDSVGVAIF